jgi:signal transduction histidine kinase/DNA-binding response OmpR family regulator
LGIGQTARLKTHLLGDTPALGVKVMAKFEARGLATLLVLCYFRHLNLNSTMNLTSLPVKRKMDFFQFLFILLLLAGAQSMLPAQSKRTAGIVDKLWPLIEPQLDHPASGDTRHFILQEVRRSCGTDYDCLYQTYYAIMIKLERRFNLPAAIHIGEEMVKVAQRQGDLEAEAGAYKNLSRFHGAIGNERLTIVNLEKALRLFEQLGNQPVVIRTQMALLERSLSYRTLEEVLPEMEALLAQAEKSKDTASVTYLHLRLLLQTQSAGLYDKMETHVEALEKVPLSDPIKPMEYGEAIHAALGRADLLKVRGKLAEAERFYQKTLRLCEAEPSRWLEIRVLHSLADLEWEQGRAALAKSYLDKAQAKAEKLELDELLASTFMRKSKIAEAEGRFANALEYIKKQHFHQEAFKAQSAGFNTQSYFLQQEKDQLATEKKNQKLELQLKKIQLRNILIIMVLVLLLAAGLFVGLRKQRKGKQELATQNALIQQQSEQLKNLDAAKSRFFANVSHELRTPLTLLLGPIKTLLKENQLTEKQTRLLQTANQSGKQLEQLVNEILDLQKLEMGKMELNEKPTPLSEFFGRYAAQFESLAHRKQIDYSVATTVGNEVLANIDQEKCRQIIYNLLSNAFKFTPEGGRIKVSLSFHNDTLQLEVADNGPGIHPDDLPHVFNRFFQTTRPDKPAEGGTGIGLALCHEYAHLFGGKIEVESTLGIGSVFRAVFPIVLSNEPLTQLPPNDHSLPTAHRPLPTANCTPHTDKPTILVVEDNPELQDYIRLILEEKYHVLTADNGQVALNRLLHTASRRPPTAYCQLILSDLMMPVMDGYQLLEKLKSSDATRHIPVIMLTARAEARDKLRALRIGVDDYLTKPFDEEELLVRIENLLRNYAARQAAMAEEPAPENAAPFLATADREWQERFEAHVQQHLSSDILSVPMLAQEFAMSESTLLRQVTRFTGLSPKQYLQEVRLHAAREMLENKTYSSVSQVAAKVGYTDARTFSRSFQQRFGKLPSEV